MSYSYDRTKTAARMDLYSEWRSIVDEHERAEQRDFEALLKELVKYLFSVGYDLDLRKSWLGKYYHGSDGVRMEGNLHVTERPENTVKHEDPRKVVEWVERATGITGSGKRNSDGSFDIDISSY